MDVIELLPRLHLLRFPVGQACLWRDGGELTLVDAGPPGSGGAVAEAVTALGYRPGSVRRIVLTHFHADHAGGAAEFAALAGSEIVAHAADAAVLLGEVPGPPPVFGDWERPLHAAAQQRLPQGEFARPTRITEVADEDVLEFGDGARVVHVPRHTDGSIAVRLPEHGVLFTGDCAAASPADGAVLPGVFHLDRPRALASFRRLASLDTDMACFGHGDPVTTGASAVLRKAAEDHSAPR
ncbi:MBL fold metallo-hydrolase [Streptomyces sp. SLBN-115]|uniref:MBL fold metallo-hydrolase n=1 Tax=Streptomyces sp. SLBN-115 TaxID=2768453 RepID=UPI00115142E4|nr:MBL fold metallo-hydrolase [Streptomyces sp. SLBN-115]TQJ47212.1 glyoxylase-like metal-dependent hydrolase (beta-lactamase superfamily II) [Streptomyces sp. SLBN-115]